MTPRLATALIFLLVNIPSATAQGPGWQASLVGRYRYLLDEAGT